MLRLGFSQFKPPPTMTELISKIKSIEEAANLEVERLGLEYLESTIKPFCKKYNLQ
jgi:hypothetical protein